MKLKNLTLACMTACGVLTTLDAQADVTIYGRIHADFENTLAGSNSAISMNKVANDLSRIGFKGDEDLGNGLKAIWQVESGVAVNDGSAAAESRGYLGTRETFIGLNSANLGTLKVGNFLVPVDDLHYIYGSMFQYTAGISNDNAVGLNGGSLATGGFDVREGNSISYQTPNFNGLSSRVQYSFTTEPGNSEQNKGGASLISGNVLYDKGPWRVGYGIQANRDMQQMSSGFYQNGLTNILTAGYTVGPFYLAGMIERDKLENIDHSGNDRSRNYGSVLAQYTVGRNQFSALFGRASSWTGGAGVADSGTRTGSVAYNYIMSKSTQVYLLYTAMHNDQNANYVLGGNPSVEGGLAVPQARNQHSIALGMWKNF